MTYVLRNADGMVVRFLDLGGIITHIEVPDRDGRMANVVLGLPSRADYAAKNGTYYLGALIGRYAGRIAGARFAIDGKDQRLVANDGPNILHGGKGFDARVWAVDLDGEATARLSLSSPDGDQGFPGRLDVVVTYRLTPDNILRIDYEASADAPTCLNLTSHSYFNLAGGGDVTGHELQIVADRRAEIDPVGIPTGEFLPVAGTAFDFTNPRPLSRHFDHSWLVGGPVAARLSNPGSGRMLEISTSEPSIHVYTGGTFPGTDIDASGDLLRPFAGIALETQHLPDSPNQPAFPTTLLRAGETFRSTTSYRFGLSDASGQQAPAGFP